MPPPPLSLLRTHPRGRCARGATLARFARALDEWTRGGALEVVPLEQSETVFAFNVTRCRYAELYQDLGIRDLGLLLSCGRDLALVEGFSPRISLRRTHTIMSGAPTCDFVYCLREAGS